MYLQRIPTTQLNEIHHPGLLYIQYTEYSICTYSMVLTVYLSPAVCTGWYELLPVGRTDGPPQVGEEGVRGQVSAHIAPGVPQDM